MKYRKKPVVVEAVKWNPTESGAQKGGWPKSKAWASAKTWPLGLINHTLIIPSLEGEVRCAPGNYVVKGVKGEFYCCRADIFEETYEKV